MRILVTAKPVINVELDIRVEDGWIREENLHYVMNAWDGNAVETAVRLKEKYGANTELVGIGEGSSEAVIRKGLAMGIDRGIDIVDPRLEKADSGTYARVLYHVVKHGDYHLVITGKQAQDTDNGHTGIMMAELAGLPCVSNVMTVERINEMQFNVCRLGDSGIEVIRLELPAVITVTDSINEPRLLTLKGIVQAKKKEIRRFNLSDIGVKNIDAEICDSKTRVIGYQSPVPRKKGKTFAGAPDEVTSRLVDILVNQEKIL
jgi:electron transfer flavoprotein beta subunit